MSVSTPNNVDIARCGTRGDHEPELNFFSVSSAPMTRRVPQSLLARERSAAA